MTHWSGRFKRQYRTVRRIRRYTCRLTERSFCLDIQTLCSKGLFKAGRGPAWLYRCWNTKEGYRGELLLKLVDYMHADEWAVLAYGVGLDKPQIIRVVFQEPHPFLRWRLWFLCPKCRRRVGTLFIPLGEFELGCRVCHRLVYWSSYCGARRIGQEQYRQQADLYRLRKEVAICPKESCDQKKGY